MAIVVRAVISTSSLACRYSSPQSSPVSVVSASSSPLQHVTRLPRKCSPRLLPELSCSASSSHSGMSLRFLKPRTNSRRSLSRTPLSSTSSLETSAVIDEAVVEPVSRFLLRNLGTLSAWSLFFGTAGAALSEITDLPSPTSANEGTPTDYLLSVLFIAAFIGLAILTTGVIYLAVTDFLENRQRVEMQKASGEEKIGKREKNEVLKVGSGKGFGVKKFEKKTEKDE